ncbi:putative SANT/Myb domain-containing protein [Helianthus debilis subsp. tardiflorus]
MAASANPSANNNNESTSNGNGATANGGGAAAAENSVVGPTQSALRHNPGLSVEWAPDEQSLLEELLTKYASDSAVLRYAKIAKKLQDKTVRDVALRCRWMTKKENGKRRKEDNNSSRKNKDKKEKVTEHLAKSSSHATNRANGPPYAQSAVSMDSDDGISYKAIGGTAGQLLEQNAQAFDQISANFAAFKVHENINLFCQAQNNIVSILNDLNDMPDIMKQMPPLPVKLNEELTNSMLPQSSLTKKA